MRVLLDGGHFFEGVRWHDGRLWVSDFFGHQVLSRGLDGDVREEAEVATDGLPVFSCALGGPDGRTLHLCVAPDFSPGPRSEAAEAQVLAVDVDVAR